jgi:hypothetical protein
MGRTDIEGTWVGGAIVHGGLILVFIEGGIERRMRGKRSLGRLAAVREIVGLLRLRMGGLAGVLFSRLRYSLICVECGKGWRVRRVLEVRIDLTACGHDVGESGTAGLDRTTE